MSFIKIELAKDQVNYSKSCRYSCFLKSKRTQISF